QADTSLGSVVIWSVFEASAGTAVLTQAPRIGTSARTRVRERRRRLDGIALRSGAGIVDSLKRLTSEGTPRHRDIPVCRITVGSQIIVKAPPPSGAQPAWRSAALSRCNPLTAATYTASGLLNLS